ncbi:hypothetical protein V6Z12_A08G169800 [Gossypium hirsutum]
MKSFIAILPKTILSSSHAIHPSPVVRVLAFHAALTLIFTWLGPRARHHSTCGCLGR